MPHTITPLLVDTDSLTERGYSVLPLFSVEQQGRQWFCLCDKGAACTSPGKHPMTRKGVKSATPFVDVARRHFRRTYRVYNAPPAINVGIATGNTNGSRNLVVLDIDPRNDGLESVRAIEERFGFTGLLIHPTVYTGGGGYHLYFRATDQPLTQLDEHDHIFRSRSNLAGYRGVDLKADGGYVVAPPSDHASGLQYTWNDNYPSRLLDVRRLPLVPHFLRELSEEDCGTKTQGAPYDATPVNTSVVTELLSIKAIKRRYDRSHGKLRDQTPSGVDYSLACLCATRVAGVSGADIEFIIQQSRLDAGLPDGKSRNYVKHTVEKAMGFAEQLRDDDREHLRQCEAALSSTTSDEMKAAFESRRNRRQR